MNFELIFKIAGLGIVLSIINMLLTKAGKDEYVMLTTLAGIILVSILLLDKINELFTLFENLFEL